jgi:hypothetical protein
MRKPFHEKFLRKLRTSVRKRQTKDFASAYVGFIAENFMTARSKSDYAERDAIFRAGLCEIYERLLTADVEFLNELATIMPKPFDPDTDLAVYYAVGAMGTEFAGLEALPVSLYKNARNLEQKIQEIYLWHIEELVFAQRIRLHERGEKRPFLDTNTIQKIVSNWALIPRMLVAWLVEIDGKSRSARKHLPRKIYTEEMFRHTWKLEKEMGHKQYRAAEDTLSKFKLDIDKTRSYLKQYRKHYLNDKRKGTKLPKIGS